MGYTDNYIRVSMPYDAALANRVIQVQLSSINGEGHMRGVEAGVVQWAAAQCQLQTAY